MLLSLKQGWDFETPPCGGGGEATVDPRGQKLKQACPCVLVRYHQ